MERGGSGEKSEGKSGETFGANLIMIMICAKALFEKEIGVACNERSIYVGD